ncbi:DUF732 domain-containing protein [Candidatus Mycobacterium wuenschmannii]|uniref:DUF732 domain-containing protein n=1 Tax=Candidatus Mycobacterium wuenschmannii TaxID=3027808 RepID=A0ABY8VU85_9MYCO|nr:DUF732 domain-containing protein [Candidatus Mycobacterium wuenschmannii]WIM86866.1 DUF732 domain-containing protein [Candidatus Mycobacterium wuenschmannii]
MTRAGISAGRALAGLAVLTGALLGPLVADVRADPLDDRFLAALQSRGINYKSAEAAIDAAHQVCTELGRGRTKDDVAQEVIDRSGLDPYHAGYFVGAAVGAYCPQFAG